jgi:hypothetical protein
MSEDKRPEAAASKIASAAWTWLLLRTILTEDRSRAGRWHVPMRASPNLVAGWIGMLAGVASGAVLGLYFHDDAWFGGYSAFRRRMLRLGHISFLGLGILNVLFALSAEALKLAPPYLQIASICLIAGAITMPLCCFLTTWHERLWVLFPVPVLAISAGLVSLLLGWPAS